MPKTQLRIRRLQPAEIDRAVAIHMDAFPDFFLTFLGSDFLKLLYRCYVNDTEEIALAGHYQQQLVATLLGTTRPQQFYRRLAKRYFLPFALASAKPLIKSPSILPRLIRALAYRGDYPPLEAGGALLASICVAVPFQGLGLGQQLVAAFEAEIFRRGTPFGYLITDHLHNDKTLNFYKKLGWQEKHHFTTQHGRRLVVLCKFPEAAPPVVGLS